jgi:hypothetical protein
MTGVADSLKGQADLLGYPRGLETLFMTEMLVLFMVAAIEE